MVQIASTTKRQRGLSILELLTGVAIGLIVVTGAVKLAIDAFGSNRRMLLETRVNQDLRAAADLIARDIRRAGHWQNSPNGVFTTNGSAVTVNPYTAITLNTNTENANFIEYQFAQDWNDTVEDPERAGFRLKNDTKVLEFRNGAGGWQGMTDPRVVQVTNLTIELAAARTVELYPYCSCLTKLTCTPDQFQNPNLSKNYVDTRPRLTIRQYNVVLAGQSTADESVQREIREAVRVRNDVMLGNCPTI